ncbi:Outer membrane Fe transport receptor protein [Xylella fastidiosa EB92.1]|nr:Outer membrane Fe transport receptor protein [Xylella fastidiosa EB92.1]
MKTFSRYTPALNHLALALASTLLLIATYTANATAAESEHSTNEDSKAAPHESKTTELDRVVITGSRIPRVHYFHNLASTAAPVYAAIRQVLVPVSASSAASGLVPTVSSPWSTDAV